MGRGWGFVMRYLQNMNRLFGLVFIVLLGALAAGGNSKPEIFGTNWLGPAAAIAICQFAFVALVQVQSMARTLDRQELKMYVDQLCRDEQGAAGSERRPSARHASQRGWSEILTQITDCIDAYRGRAEEAEHGKASAEVRVRRLINDGNRMSAIVDGLAEPVLAVNHYGELVLANPIAQDLFNFKADRTEKVAIERLVQCEELISLLTETRSRTLPAQRSSEITVTRTDGEKRHYRVTCKGIGVTSDGGEAAASSRHGAVAVLSDISNEKAIQKRNAEFVSSVSHEMKTPLAGIKAYVELLADDEADDEEMRHEFLDVIAGQAERLQRLIENLLNLARIEAGVVSVSKQKYSLNEILEEAVGVVQPSAEAKRLALSTDLSPMYLAVYADRDMLLQTAINLLSNAIKYTPDGGAVTMRSRTSDLGIVFEVEDTGVGLSVDDQHNVFEKFYRVKKDQNMAPGTGLGLPLAKHIVEDVHGGQLTLQSELGVGSTFRVTLASTQSPQWVGGVT